MNITKHYDGIYEVENFLTDEEINIILSPENPNQFIDLWHGTTVQDIMPSALSTVEEISNRFMSCLDNASSHTYITNIRRLKEGENMPPHIDSGYEEGKGTKVFGVVIYLNDDFTGGDLKYPDLDIAIKPKKASLMIHSANILHKVLRVTSGNRYCLTSFIFGDESTKVKE